MMTSTRLGRAKRNVHLLALVALAALICAAVLVAEGSPRAGSATTTSVGLYTGSEVVPGPGENDPNAVELGVAFQVAQPSVVTAIRFYKTSGNTGAHTGTLWSGSGEALATVEFRGESAVGWQSAQLSASVTIQPQTTYVVSYHTDAGFYAQQTQAFADGRTIGNSSVWGTSGLYRYGGDSGFPNQTWEDSAYFVDALITPAAPDATDPPSPTASDSASPSPSPTTSGPGTAGGVGIYDGVESVPGSGENDAFAVELGVTFQVGQSGSITAIRFHKSIRNTGGHTGTLWGADGSVLARVTFANESASGWQTAELSAPVPVEPGRSYVVSYHTNAGFYSQDEGAFAGGKTIGNSSIWGTSGVYWYGPQSSFPRASWHDSAYFVDALFSPGDGSTVPPSATPSTTPPTADPTSTSPSSSTPPPSSTPSSTSPSPTPPGSSTAQPPASIGFPDAGSTGSRVADLRNVPGDVRQGAGWHYDDRGWVEIDGAGAVFSGFRVGVNVNVSASDVVISDNVMQGANDWNISLRGARNVTIDHNTISGASSSRYCDNAIRDIPGDSDGVTITANNMYWCLSAINHFDGGGLIRGNYIHDIGGVCTGSDPNCGHFNGIQLGSGYGPLMTIDHNTILNPSTVTDAIMLANDDGAQTNRTITNNLLGGGGYTFYGSGGPDGRATNIVFTGNQFTTRYFPLSGSFGPVAHWQSGGAGNVWAGNVWADGPRAGQPVNP